MSGKGKGCNTDITRPSESCMLRRQRLSRSSPSSTTRKTTSFQQLLLYALFLVQLSLVFEHRLHSSQSATTVLAWTPSTISTTTATTRTRMTRTSVKTTTVITKTSSAAPTTDRPLFSPRQTTRTRITALLSSSRLGDKESSIKSKTQKSNSEDSIKKKNLKKDAILNDKQQVVVDSGGEDADGVVDGVLGSFRGWFSSSSRKSEDDSQGDDENNDDDAEQQEQQQPKNINGKKIQNKKMVKPKNAKTEKSSEYNKKNKLKKDGNNNSKEDGVGSFFTRVQTAWFSKNSTAVTKSKATSVAVNGDQSSTSSEGSIFVKIQGLFARDGTNNSSTANESNKSKSDLKGSTTSPLSVVQKLLEGPIASVMSSTTQLVAQAQKEEEWITVFPKTRIMPGELVPVTVAGLDLLVIASKDGRRLYCIANSCPHLGTPLETGNLVRLPRAATASSTTTSSSASGEFSSSSSPSSSVFTTLPLSFTETDISNMLSQDGCEDCIVCPLHRTSFALESGDVRGEWCPYPPVLGKFMGTVKPPTGVAIFDVRTRGKNVQVRINTPLVEVKN